MGVLDDFVLHFEKLPSEGRAWLKDTVNAIGGRARRIPTSRAARAVKSELDRDIPTLRLFRRIRQVESQLDKPFLYDSALLKRIENIEADIARKESGKNGK